MQLTKPIIFFDLETTGVSTSKDRIVQIGAIKIYPDGTTEEKDVLINPTIPIPAAATAVHGISDEAVREAPLFRQISKSFLSWLSGADLAGYNSDQFDLPMLIEEFARAGLSFPEEGTRCIDVLKIERNVNSHRLEETYKRYTGNTLDGAHNALADIKATVAVFELQLEKNKQLPSDIDELDQFCQGENGRVDYAGKMYEKEGQIYWAFGKHRGELVTDTKEYAAWVLQADFPLETKEKIRKVLEVI